MSAGTNSRPDEPPLGVFLVENFDGIRVQVIVSVTAPRLARVTMPNLVSGRAGQEEALAAAHHALHMHGKRALDELRDRAQSAISCFVEQLEVCEREHADLHPIPGVQA